MTFYWCTFRVPKNEAYLPAELEITSKTAQYLLTVSQKINARSWKRFYSAKRQRTAPSSYASSLKQFIPGSRMANISIIFSTSPCLISTDHLFAASGSVVSRQNKIITDLSFEYRTPTRRTCLSCHSTSFLFAKKCTPLCHVVN